MNEILDVSAWMAPIYLEKTKIKKQSYDPRQNKRSHSRKSQDNDQHYIECLKLVSNISWKKSNIRSLSQTVAAASINEWHICNMAFWYRRIRQITKHLTAFTKAFSSQWKLRTPFFSLTYSSTQNTKHWTMTLK